MYFLKYYIYDYWQEVSDPRSKDLFLMEGGPWKVFAFISCYLLFVTKIGSKLMNGRKAFELRIVMLFYNFMVVLINGYFFCVSVYYLDYGRNLLDFKFPDKNKQEFYSQYELGKIRLVYLYAWTKVIDLMDTIFFVLRKKDSQITGLHLYHHSIMPVFGWLVIKIAPTANCLGIFPLINTIIHVIMYSYYGLSALGPRIQPYLWWKKYLTQLQLAQFVIFAIYAIIFVFKQQGYPTGLWLSIGFPQPFIFGVMFFHFYRSSYQRFTHNFVNNNNENNVYKNEKINKNFGKQQTIKAFIDCEIRDKKLI